MWIVQAFALVLAVGLGLMILARRVDAQPAKAAPPAAAAAKATTPIGPKGKDAGADADAVMAEPKDDAKNADGGALDPIDYTILQGDEDFPPGMSDEARNSIGTGKVPIHREGAYRSPLAHPRFGGPTTVKVGLVIREIRDFNIQTGGFEADFFLSLMGDKDLPTFNLAFTNGHEVTLAPIVDTSTFKVFSVTGKFTTDVDLRAYPFDTQVLDIAMEDQRAGVDQLIFEPYKERTSLDSSFRLSSFSAAAVGAVAYKHKYPSRFDRDDLYVSRYKFSVSVQRFATSAAFSVYVPALIIVLISLTGMWVPPSELEVRSNAGAPMLAAAVLFHYSLIQSLPATGYLTHADKLMLGVYVSLLLNMLSTWFLLLGEDDYQVRVFKIARTTVPIATAIVMGLSIVI